MHRPGPRRRHATASALLLLSAATALLAPATALATVTISRAEIKSGTLRIEGRAIANRSITVDGVPMATSDGVGDFRISRNSYSVPPDCTVDVNDNSATPTSARLSGCTVTTPPPTAAPGILPDVVELGPGYVGADFSANASSSTVVNFGPGATGPVRFEVVAGALPAGLSIIVPAPGGRPRPPSEETYMYIDGTPTTVGSSTFTLRATDANGLTATRTYTIHVNPARAMAITPQPWAPLVVGTDRNLWIDGSGGVLPYAWAVTAGALPTGMSLIQDSPDSALVRIGGTPTTAGTFDWTLRLTDAQGSTTSRDFTATVAPGALSSLALSPSTVTGGATSNGTVTLATPAGSDGAWVDLTSSNLAAATVPGAVVVPAGATSASFTISTSAVSSNTTSTISAIHAGITQSATLTVNAPAPPPSSSTDTVSISRAEHDSGKRVLRVEATSSGSGATLRVYVTSTNALVGTLSGGRGEFSMSSNPQSITVRSSLGGSATRTVTAR